MYVKRYNSSSENQWNDFIKTSKNGFFMFDRKYMDYHSDRFEDHSLMIYNDSDKLMAVFPANIRDGVIYSHQGLTFGGVIFGKKMRTPLILEVFDAIIAYGVEHNFNKIYYKAIPYFYHKQPSQEDIYAIYRNNGICTRVDVSSTIEYGAEQYTFSSSRKSGLKKARSCGLRVEKTDDYDRFFNLMNDLLGDKYNTTATHSAEEMTMLAGKFPNYISLYTVEQNSKLLAGVIIYETSTVAHTQYMGASIQGKEIGALDLILDHLINQVYTHKSYFDFGISTENNGMYLNETLIDQKEGAGARSTVHQCYEINL